MMWKTIKLNSGRGICGALVLLTVAAGCGSSGKEGPATAAGYPREIENCGHTTTYQAPPERAVTFDQNITETLLALGLGDRIAGYARQHFVADQPVLSEYQDEYDDLELLSEGDFPKREALLAAEPDFVFAAFPYELSDQFGLSRESLESDGINTYVQQVECGDEAEKVTFERYYEDLRQIGRIFDVEEEADALADKMAAETSQITSRVAARGGEPVRVFVYDSGTSSALSTGGTSMSNQIIEAAGGVNIFKDVPEHFPEVSWEEVLARDPEVIVTMNYSISDPPASAQADLLAQRLATTTAMKQNRVISLPLIDFFPSLRNPATVQTLAQFIDPGLG